MEQDIKYDSLGVDSNCHQAKNLFYTLLGYNISLLELSIRNVKVFVNLDQ